MPEVLAREAEPTASFQTVVTEAYQVACSAHGDLELGMPEYCARLSAITRKLSRNAATSVHEATLLRSLNTSDLYLSIACAHSRDAAWQRFDVLYGPYIRHLATYLCSARHFATEITQSISVHLFLPDKTGQSRMFSYDGRSSLATWLRVIVMNMLINEGQRKCNSFEYVLPQNMIHDDKALASIEYEVKKTRYESLLTNAVRRTCESLPLEHKQLLLWRFGAELQLGAIARRMGVHQSTVTRMINRITAGFREQIIHNLKREIGHESAIAEALSLLRDEQSTSISIIEHLQADPSACAQRLLNPLPPISKRMSLGSRSVQTARGRFLLEA